VAFSPEFRAGDRDEASTEVDELARARAEDVATRRTIA